MNDLSTEILIVGGGATRMAAPVAASERAQVTIVDDNPHLGGQIWRAELGRSKSPEARQLIEKITSGGIKVVNNAQVYGTSDTPSLFAEVASETTEIEYRK